MNPTVALTLLLLTTMMGAGVATGFVGFKMGSEALKGITQPDLRPTSVGETPKKPHQQTMMIVPEDQILAQVTARINGQPVPEPTPVAVATPGAAAEATPSPTPGVTAEVANAGLPVATEVEGVKLEVQSVEKQENSLILNVTLTNTSEKSVQFLYSFLNLVDDQGRSFTPTTNGLPGELPPQSETFTGTVTLNSTELSGANTLTMTLLDYPNQQLRLELPGIPVVR